MSLLTFVNIVEVGILEVTSNMKLIIAGGRDYYVNDADHLKLDEILVKENVTEVVSGGASGADYGGELWAAKRGIPIKKFPANWYKHGKAAGFMRNTEMAAYADAVVLFPGGRGTEHMGQEATRTGLKIFNFTKQVIKQKVKSKTEHAQSNFNPIF